jgi:hypothetical protein
MRKISLTIAALTIAGAMSAPALAAGDGCTISGSIEQNVTVKVAAATSIGMASRAQNDIGIIRCKKVSGSAKQNVKVGVATATAIGMASSSKNRIGVIE